MLGHHLKRKEQEAGNPEAIVQLKEARRLMEEKDEVITQQQNEIRELRDRLGLNAEDCQPRQSPPPEPFNPESAPKPGSPEPAGNF